MNIDHKFVLLDELIYGIFVHWKVVKIVYVVFLKQLISKLKYSGFGKTFEVTHNISADQSPLIVNRTNVTLYGVQPWEAYIVGIIPILPLHTCNLHVYESYIGTTGNSHSITIDYSSIFYHHTKA